MMLCYIDMLYLYGVYCRQVCGENLIYRHILKKHLRQVHGINPQNLDDRYVFTVYMYSYVVCGGGGGG